jgi:hypothetical protein
MLMPTVVSFALALVDGKSCAEIDRVSNSYKTFRQQ